MPREVVLSKIRDAERQRLELEEGARQRKDRILQEARLAAQKLVEDAAVAGDAAASERVALEVRNVQEERKKITSDSERDTARRRDASRARLAQTAGYIVNEFTRQLDA